MKTLCRTFVFCFVFLYVHCNFLQMMDISFVEEFAYFAGR
jgi:hypothetical protein|nr:MAG TPA: hypothetical protein [Caudoviricetes sp.]